ncbi:MAG TPA: class I SAM-dependent methyltransferase [Ignavibacteriaceae bacterium]|nr:class I SAM-dependent methyltransferase [Ignavibacteriaceae bacterium]
MEVEKEIQREYNPEHPNYERWQKARDLSYERAQFVENIISKVITPAGLTILDIGAGEGITSKLFSQNNFVVSLEPKPERVKRNEKTDSFSPVIADSLNLPIKSDSFDLIILQDVIEHLSINKKLIEEFTSLLKKNGIIYLSTPNKFSLINIISDPHWGMPFLSLFKRNQIKKYFLKYFRKSDYSRDDVAELLSLKRLYDLFGQYYSLKIFTKFSVEYLINGGKGLVWSKFHLRLVRMVNLLGLKKLLMRIANDQPGIINKFFTPTFYISLKKK